MKSQYLSTKNEIKFAVEAMTQCGANCIGCFLTPELRLAQDFWDDTRFSQAKSFIRSSIHNLEVKLGQSIDEIAINMGQGDYFQLKEEDIRKVVDFVFDCADGRASAFITASGITNHNKLKQSVDTFYEYSLQKKQALLIDFVLDASRLSSDKMFKIYADNLSYIRSKFGHIDVNLNINEDTVSNVTPEQINNFMILNKLKFLVVNVVPAEHNKKPLQRSWNKIMQWMEQLYEIWNKDNYELNYANGIKTLQLAYPSELSLMDTVQTSIKEVMLKEYVIDNQGNICFQQAGFGDLPLSTRNGFTPIGNINQPYNYQTIEQQAKKLCITIQRLQGEEPCGFCDYKSVCSANGMFVAKEILNEEGSSFESPVECPINIYNLYQKIENSSDKHTLKSNNSFSGVYVQKGLVSDKVRKENIDYIDEAITIFKNKFE